MRRPWPGAALLGAALLGALAAGAAAPRTAPTLDAEAAPVFRRLVALRGVPVSGGPPPVVVRTREERRRFITGEIARKFPPSRLEAEQRALLAWGLVPPDFDLGRFMVDLLLEQAAAYYDPTRKVMVLASWLPREQQREALTHELVHALQDRQIDLDRFLTAEQGRGDSALARQTLVEGEAVALGLDLALAARGEALERLPDVEALARAIEVSATGPVLGRAPPFVRSLLTFPYSAGVRFVHAFRRRHPWPALSRLYRDPPRSTAQILHPERYLDRREDPLSVILPDLAPALGPGASRAFEDDVGEVALGAILREFLGEAVTMGHWRGDRYALWTLPGGTTLLLAVTVWATQADARGFAEAYARLLPRKHGLGPPAEPGEHTVWTRGREAFVVERRERDVLLVERAPAAAVDAIRAAVWAAR